jgi:hypothetical protein
MRDNLGHFMGVLPLELKNKINTYIY